MSMRKVRLAMPLDAANAAKLRAKEIRDYQVREEVTLPLEDAQTLISAGYVLGVEPSNPRAVADALNISVQQAATMSGAQVSAEEPAPAAKSSGKK